MKRRSSILTGALMSAAMLLALASPAWAPRAWGIPNLVAPCTGGNTFVGSVFLNDFDSKVTLVAHGSVVGACRPVGDTSSTGGVDTTFVVPATLGDASCESLSVTLGSVDGGHDLTIEMSSDPILLDNPTQDPKLRRLMCLVMGRDASGLYDRQPLRLVSDLDKVLLALKGL